MSRKLHKPVLTDRLAKMGRLALRIEGPWWTAYYAMPNTMEGAITLGKIRMYFVDSEERRQVFMDLMKECIGDIFEDRFGKRPEWPDGPQPAPEHEKSGSA